jgi:hypothetical protein
MENRFQNPSNGYTEEVGCAFLWCFLFGIFYFMVKRQWAHVAVLAMLIVLSILTYGIALPFLLVIMLFVYPFFAKGIVRRSYLRKGWIPVE